MYKLMCYVYIYIYIYIGTGRCRMHVMNYYPAPSLMPELCYMTAC